MLNNCNNFLVIAKAAVDQKHFLGSHAETKLIVNMQ